ncbi:MAG TPA: nuclear transport factor 2 family protein [Acidimicrobiia bacterium]|nr:nuclear transport factor 2 family protein [Acidimicrobiia bacterium]
MGEHPNVAVYREVHENLQKGNFQAAFDALDDEVVWHQLGAETLHGKDAVVAVMSGMEEFGADNFDIDIHDVVGNGEHVIGLVTTTLNMGDQSFSYRTAEIAHMKDGKLTERWAFSDDTQRIIEFFASMESG